MHRGIAACRSSRTWATSSLAERLVHCTRIGTPVDSIRDAVLTVFPKTVYFLFLLPTTLPTMGPESNPARISTCPFDGSSGSISVVRAISIISWQPHTPSQSNRDIKQLVCREIADGTREKAAIRAT
eukprot:3561126-Rhodomonas_salina.1